VREFAAKQNQPAENFLAAEEAEMGMVEMSALFKEKGGEIYMGADPMTN
jgi:phosphomethylpyrimidine synthase